MGELDELREQVRDEMARWHVPGVAVGVLRDGRRETFGLGVASLETEFPVRPDTLFQVGSISKVYAATLVDFILNADGQPRYLRAGGRLAERVE